MNILPKKRWHVRTRENIARVRRDEALAEEEERKRQERILLAEKESRRDLLRSKAREQYRYISPKKEKPEPVVREGSKSGHFNLFYELEENETVTNKTNADHEREKKEEREKEEMKIGYLTYLGQDTNELTGNVSWYNKDPKMKKYDEKEVGLKEKLLADPLKDIKHYLGTEGLQNIFSAKESTSSTCSNRPITDSRHKKKKQDKRRKSRRRSSSSSSSDRDRKKKKTNIDISKLREERIRREKIERDKAAAALAKLREPEASNKSANPAVDYVQKYSSQFNPHLARQNFA